MSDHHDEWQVVPLRHLFNEQGQSLLETCIALLAMIPLFALTLELVYLGVARIWIHHVAHEAAMCILSSQSRQTCRTQTQNQLELLGPRETTANNSEQMQIWLENYANTNSGRRARVKIQLRLWPNININEEQNVELTLPNRWIRRAFSSEKGSALLHLLSFIPLLLAAFFTLTVMFKTLQQHSRSLYICRTLTLKLEESRLKGLQKLMQLNPQAKRLRIEKRTAEAELKVAMSTLNAAAIAQAKSHLAAVTLKQGIFHGKQIELITQINLKAGKEFQLIKQSILAEFQNWPSPVQIVATHMQPLSIRADPYQSLSPDYLPSANFTENESIYFKWKYRSQPFSQFQSQLGNHSNTQVGLQDIIAECGASGNVRQGDFHPILYLPQKKFSMSLIDNQS